MDKKCRNCFEKSAYQFCSTKCKEQFEAKYFGNVVSNDASAHKTYTQFFNDLPTLEHATTGKSYPKISDLMNSEKMPSYQEALQALPTFEELQYGAVSDTA